MGLFFFLFVWLIVFSCTGDINFRYVFFIFYFKDVCWLSLTVILTFKVEANLTFSQIYLHSWLDLSAVEKKIEVWLQVICTVIWPALVAYVAPAVSFTSGDALCSFLKGLLRACCVRVSGVGLQKWVVEHPLN